MVDIINSETKISKVIVNQVINSFINNFSLVLKHSNSLYINNIGEFYMSEQESSKYTRYDRRYTNYKINYIPSVTLLKTLNNTSINTLSL